MDWLWVWILSSIFGIVTEVKQMSMQDRSAMQKYMEVWRSEVEPMARMMSKFSTTATRYIGRNRLKRRG